MFSQLSLLWLLDLTPYNTWWSKGISTGGVFQFFRSPSEGPLLDLHWLLHVFSNCWKFLKSADPKRNSYLTLEAGTLELQKSQRTQCTDLMEI